MGLLDDAIREHLDLKRRRGADPTEIEQAERDALGPVRRGPDEIESGEQSEDLVAAEEPQAFVENGQEQWGESFDEESELFGEESAPPFGHVPAEAGQHEPFADAPRPEFSDEFATRVYEPEPEPEPHEDLRESAPPEPPPAPPQAAEPPAVPAAEEPPPSPTSRPSQETAEYDVEQELHEPPPDAPAKDGEDVLEETPEFLQDTPDHDRLWFEQRPPRDFDFEG